MKTRLLASLLCFALTITAYSADLVGKTVVIKTSKEGTSGIVLDSSAPKIRSLNTATPENSQFRVAAGIAPDSVAFESVGQPGFFLHHTSKHLVLLKKINNDASFRVVPPMEGTQGVSLQSINFPDHHVVVITKDSLMIAKDIKHKRDAVFHIEERK